MKSSCNAVDEAIPDMETKVKVSLEQFQTLSQSLFFSSLTRSDTLMEIAAQQLVHLQHYRSLCSTYKTMVRVSEVHDSQYEEEKAFGADCMTGLMEQQETINKCLNDCIGGVASLNQDLLEIKEERDGLTARVSANEDAADRTVEEAAEAVQAAEKLSFLSEQQLFDIEKQYRNQEKTLLETQASLLEKEEENAQLRQKLEALQKRIDDEADEEKKETHEAQWHLILPSESSSETPSHENEFYQINRVFSDWGKNKSVSHVNEALNWLEVMLSGKKVSMENGYNTIELSLFDLGQREAFKRVILPLLFERKNLECFVQEHRRREFDYRITVLNKDEAIPAIIVPKEGAREKKNDNDELKRSEESEIQDVASSEFVPLQKESEEEEMEEISRPVIDTVQSSAPKEKKKKAKMISLD